MSSSRVSSEDDERPGEDDEDEGRSSVGRALQRLARPRGVNQRLALNKRVFIENALNGKVVDFSKRAGAARAQELAAEQTLVDPDPPRSSGDDERLFMGRIGRYPVLEVLGSGGMGEVYRAYDGRLRREVAIKVVKQELGQRDQTRLQREAQALARLSHHPNVVTVYDAEELDGQLSITMELIHGDTLRKWQKQRRSWQECLDVYIQAGRGLAAAHDKGLVHRDFKPGNCMIDADGRVCVLDFGLVCEAGSFEAVEPHFEERGASPTPEVDASSSALMLRLTQTGSVLGTPLYMAPEQFKGESVDAKSDQYSYCVALYEALCGQLPYAVERVPARKGTASELRRTPRSMPSGAKIPKWLQRALARGLAHDPDERWPSMDELLRELERGRRGVGVRRWSLLGVGVVAISLAGVALWPDPCEGAERELASVWNDDLRQQVNDAILATNVPYAEQTIQTIDRRLDNYAERWVGERRAACEATRVHDVQSVEMLERRKHCLNRRRTALEYDVELLRQADAALVERAVELVGQLPRVMSCADMDALAKTPNVTLTAEQQERLDGAQQDLEEVRSSLALERYDEALGRVEPLVTRARALGEPEFLARSLLVAGRLHGELERYGEAEARLREAQTVGLEVGADAVAAEAMAERIHLDGVERDETERALILAKDTALPLARRVAPKAALEASVLTAMAHVRTVRGEYVEAEENYQQALEILELIPGERLALADSLNGRATALRRMDKGREAVDLSRRSWNIYQEVLGDLHPKTSSQRTNLGEVLVGVGDIDEGIAHFESALDALESASGSDQSRVAHTRLMLGHALYQQRRYERATVELEKALSLFDESEHVDRRMAIYVRSVLATVYKKRGLHARAVEVYEQVNDLLDEGESTPARRLMTVDNLGALGEELRKEKRLQEAQNRFDEALSILRVLGATSKPNAAPIYNRYGDLRSDQGDVDGAEKMFDRALKIYESLDDPAYDQKIASTSERIGRLHHREERWSRALAPLERARALLRQAEGAVRAERLLEIEAMLDDVHAHVEPSD